MRLWDYRIISSLPTQQLMGLHRECCALRGQSWGKKHMVVDYVWKHPYYRLFLYHKKVMFEIKARDIAELNPDWLDPNYTGISGRIVTKNEVEFSEEVLRKTWARWVYIRDQHSTFLPGTTTGLDVPESLRLYPEHDDLYLLENLLNLAGKGVKMDFRFWYHCKNTIDPAHLDQLIKGYKKAIKPLDMRLFQKNFYSWVPKKEKSINFVPSLIINKGVKHGRVSNVQEYSTSASLNTILDYAEGLADLQPNV